jgi:hypothetical protein
LITVLLGAAMAAVFGVGLGLPLGLVLDLHVAWGLGGWLFALLAGVVATVLPMFWHAPKLTSPTQRYLPWLIWAPLLAGSVTAPFGDLLVGWGQVAGWLAVLGLAGLGLAAVLLASRKWDVAWRLWLVAALAWCLTGGLGLIASLIPAEWPVAWWLGVLVLVGGALLPVNAMLGKIVPFLVWLNLRKRLPARTRIPAVQSLLPPSKLRLQAALLIGALGALLALPFAPRGLTVVAGLLLATSQAWLAVVLLGVLTRGLRLLRQT